MDYHPIIKGRGLLSGIFRVCFMLHRKGLIAPLGLHSPEWQWQLSKCMENGQRIRCHSETAIKLHLQTDFFCSGFDCFLLAVHIPWHWTLYRVWLLSPAQQLVKTGSYHTMHLYCCMSVKHLSLSLFLSFPPLSCSIQKHLTLEHLTPKRDSCCFFPLLASLNLLRPAVWSL